MMILNCELGITVSSLEGRRQVMLAPENLGGTFQSQVEQLQGLTRQILNLCLEQTV